VLANASDEVVVIDQCKVAAVSSEEVPYSGSTPAMSKPEWFFLHFNGTLIDEFIKGSMSCMPWTNTSGNSLLGL
jgi:hypothetical protein